MTYLRALQLLTKAYKAARGRLPEGLDLLKVKQKARQKAIDSNKVIDAAEKFDKGNWFRLNKKPAKEGFGKPKKVETEAEMLARMKKQNKEAVQRLKEKKKPREDKATGGLTNISATYDNNPTLQEQFPDKQDYLDLFSSTTTTTPKTQTYAQMAQQSPAGITAVKPIVPIIPPQGDGDGGGGGGITTVDKGLTSADDYGLGVADQTGMGYQLTEKDLEDIDKARFTSGIKSLGYDVKQLFKNLPTIKALKSGKDFALNLIEKAKAAARARELARLQEAARAAGFQGDTRTKDERDFASSQTYGGGGSDRDMGADTFT
jgi:hypothetical protein